jgi:hypothetical protein
MHEVVICDYSFINVRNQKWKISKSFHITIAFQFCIYQGQNQLSVVVTELYQRTYHMLNIQQNSDSLVGIVTGYRLAGQEIVGQFLLQVRVSIFLTAPWSVLSPPSPLCNGYYVLFPQGKWILPLTPSTAKIKKNWDIFSTAPISPIGGAPKAGITLPFTYSY